MPEATLNDLKCRVASLTRWREPEDPEITDARAKLREAKITEQIRRIRASDPPLTDEQRTRLAAILLAPSGDHDVLATK